MDADGWTNPDSVLLFKKAAADKTLFWLLRESGERITTPIREAKM